MKIIFCPLLSLHRKLIALHCVVFVALVLFGMKAIAQAQQCSDTNSSDSAAECTSQPTEVTLPTISHGASVPLPGADHASEASANGSLSSGANYNEVETKQKRPTSGLLNRGSEEPLTEFQRFVAASTGELLPIYGAHLFTEQPERFAPTEQAAAPSELIVATGDELRIRIWGQVNFSANLRVSREGEIYLPKVGSVHVAGLPFSAVAAHIRSALDRVYRNYEFSVDLGEIHAIQVYITGQAHKPGEYTVSGLSTLVDAIFSSGGPSASGSMRHILLKRQGKVVTDFDLYALLIAGDKTGDMQLQSGDVIYIPPVGAQVALYGSVRQAGIYELRGEEMLGQLLDASGGKTAIAQGAHVSVERIEENAVRRAFEISSNAAGLATFLKDGDIVRVDSIVSNYRATVTLRGSVASPGHFRWHTGMHLSELMPDRDSLVSRDYWWHRTQLGIPTPEFTPLIEALKPPRKSENASTRVPLSSQKTSNLSDSILQTEPDAALQPQTQDEQPKDTTYSPHGEQSTIAGTNDEKEGLQQSSVALLRPRAQTNWNYAVIERLDPATMTTTLIPFNLGKLVLNHDAAQDLELKPGDVVTIFSEDDIHLPIEQQTKYVRLDGEFVHAGIYSVQQGETLRVLVDRAGGLTNKAYLYGSEFTRKSTRVLEQQRLNEYAEQLEQQMQHSSLSVASGTGSAQDGVAATEAAAMRREIIARLHQMRATGRVVLEMRPGSTGINALPELALEDGDRLVVPSRPATVQVSGAVMNQNAFLFNKTITVADYLNLAGGASRAADARRSFILRADGSITPHHSKESLFATNFGNLRLNPGDTIVVPEKIWRPSRLTEIMAWVQVFSSLSLGAAAIDVIK